MAAGPFYAGQVVSAAALNSIAPNGVVKPSGESRASDTTLTADTNLTVPLLASATYIFEGQIGYDGGVQGSSDMQLGWTIPAGATFRWGASYLNTSGAAAWSQWLKDTDTIVAGTNTTSVQRQVALRGSIIMGASDGTLALTWAQNTSDATNLTVLVGSWLAFWRTS